MCKRAVVVANPATGICLGPVPESSIKQRLPSAFASGRPSGSEHGKVDVSDHTAVIREGPDVPYNRYPVQQPRGRADLIENQSRIAGDGETARSFSQGGKRESRPKEFSRFRRGAPAHPIKGGTVQTIPPTGFALALLPPAIASLACWRTTTRPWIDTGAFVALHAPLLHSKRRAPARSRH